MIRLPRPARGEQGNIIIAMMIILVITTIGTAVVFREVGDQSVVLGRQRVAGALATANAGLSDALFRLDQGSSAEGNGSQFYVDTSGTCSATCVSSSVPGIASGSAVKYLATQISATKWTIDAEGTLGSQTASVHEIVTRSAKFPFALFANSSLTFNGNATGSFSTYDDTQTASSSNPNTSGQVAIGSNGSITCNGGIGNNVQADYYNTGSVSSISGGCGNPQSFSTTYYLPPVSTTGLATNCPNDGQLGSTYSYPTLTAESIPYVCKQPVTISGLLKVVGSVTFYIDLSGNSDYNSSTAALTIKTPSYVNDLYDYCANVTDSTNCVGVQDLPNAQNLQILVNSTGQVGFDNGHGYYFGGILYAPQAYLTQDGCKSHYFGAITINTLTCNGGPHLYVSYDSSLGSLYGNWVVSGYSQMSPTSVSIP
ncbi:MAG TPA: hypothetical protein VKI19_12755 [Acidimicrobiales bacterium]|nr:hypothetical protein [Acidimicrobiales bacterium]